VAEPTIADVLTRLDRLDARAEVAQLEIRAGLAELRASLADHRASLAELRTEVAELRQRLNLMFDFLAD
jgi:multidrug resistance efflux pump